MAESTYDTNFEVEETENFKYGEENKFNHQSLVMQSMKKCLEAGSEELIEGWWDEKLDRNGNAIRSYNKDTRKKFINSVESLMGITECDWDNIAEKIIKEILADLYKRKEYWLAQEQTWWNSLSNSQKDEMVKQGRQVTPGFFNKKLDFDNLYYDEETKAYRRIFAEINNLTSRLDFYGNVDYEA